MRDPHIAADVFTYEGDAIKDWLHWGHTMSPMTYLCLTHNELITLPFVLRFKNGKCNRNHDLNVQLVSMMTCLRSKANGLMFV
jgi:hypothetical protein